MLDYCKGSFDFRPVDYQKEFMLSCLNNQFTLAVFCRQSGKSECTAKVAIIQARRIPNNPILVFAPTDRQAGLIALKITNTIKKMPYYSHFHIIRQTHREFYFSNGGSIICETTGDTGQTILGYTAGAIIMEEAGSIKDSIVHSSILPMGATTNPPIIKIGTPKGMNHFYESYKDERYNVFQITWEEGVRDGIVQQEYVDQMRSTLPADMFRVEMNAEFLADQDAYFGYDLIEACTGNVEMIEKSRGKYYYLGADIARFGSDSTCLMVVEKDGNTNKVVKIVDIPKSTLDYVIDKIEQLHDVFSFTRIFIDETGLGSGVRDVLARKYNIWKKDALTRADNTFQQNDLIIGVKFTIQSKIDIYSKLKVLMEQGKLMYPKNPKLIAQLRDFRFEITDSGNVKLHHSEYGQDDYCDALALSVWGIQTGGAIIDF